MAGHWKSLPPPPPLLPSRGRAALLPSPPRRRGGRLLGRAMRRDLRELRRHPRRMCRPAAASVAPPTTGGGVGAAQDILNEPPPLVPALEVRGRRRVAQDLRHVRGGVGGLSRRQRRRERERDRNPHRRAVVFSASRAIARPPRPSLPRGIVLFCSSTRFAPPSAPPLPPSGTRRLGDLCTLLSLLRDQILVWHVLTNLGDLREVRVHRAHHLGDGGRLVELDRRGRRIVDLRCRGRGTCGLGLFTTEV